MPSIKLKESYIFIPVLIAYIILGVFYPFLKINIAKFLLFQALFLLLPGYMFSRWFISEGLTKIQRCVFGYPVSMVVIFILSWTGKLLNIKYFESLILLFSMMSIYNMAKESGKEPEKNTNLLVMLSMLLYGICAIIVFRMFILPSSAPTPECLGLYYEDSLWTVGNTWAYIRSFPLEDSKFSGVLFGYHMLQNIYQAIVYDFTKTDPFYVHFAVGPLFYWFIAVFIVFYGGIKIAKLSVRKVIIFCAGLFFTTAFFSGGMQENLFINPLSFCFGLPVFILFIYYIISYLNKERELDIVYMAFLYIYFTAAKSILGIIVLCVLTALVALNMFKKKFVFKEVYLIISLIFGAILLRFTMFQNSIHQLYLYYEYDTSKSLAYRIFKQMYFIRNHVDTIYPVYRFFSTFFRYLPEYIFNWQVLLFFIVFFTDKKFREKIKDARNLIIFILFFFLACMITGCILYYPGAYIYNIWYFQAVFLFLGVYVLEYIFTIKNLHYKIISILLIGLSVTVYASEYIGWVKRGEGSLLNAKERVWDKRASISYDEWLAMAWLKKNTSSDKIFFSDRRYFSQRFTEIDLPRFYGYTALSGRQAFAEGEGGGLQLPPGKVRSIVYERWALINRFLSSLDLSEQERLLKDIKADYFIQSLRFNSRDFSKIANLKLVYENKDVKIFEILR